VFFSKFRLEKILGRAEQCDQTFELKRIGYLVKLRVEFLDLFLGSSHITTLEEKVGHLRDALGSFFSQK